MRRTSTFLLAALLGCACASGGTRGDGAVPEDAGARSDASVGPDAGLDAGSAPDAGPIDGAAGDDAGGSDAGTDAGPPAPMCTGTPSMCSVRAVATCEAQLGCRTGRSCRGTPLPCSRFTSSFDCLSNPACDYVGGACVDDGRSCTAFIGPDTCALVGGCMYIDVCLGSPTPCAGLTTAQCASQDGCSPI